MGAHDICSRHVESKVLQRYLVGTTEDIQFSNINKELMLGREVRTKNKFLRIIHMEVKITTKTTMRQEKMEGKEREAEDRTVKNTYF